MARTDLNTAKDFVLYDPAPKLPSILSILIGEVVYNLRAALDYLIFDLALLDTGSPQSGTQFPIEDTPEGFAGHRRGFLKGLSDKHVALIEALQPYNRNNFTAMIRDISNPDKHRKLTVIGSNGVYGVKTLRASEQHRDPKTGVVSVYRVEIKSEFIGHIAFKDNEMPALDTLNILQAEVAKILGDFK